MGEIEDLKELIKKLEEELETEQLKNKFAKSLLDSYKEYVESLTKPQKGRFFF